LKKTFFNFIKKWSNSLYVFYRLLLNYFYY